MQKFQKCNWDCGSANSLPPQIMINMDDKDKKYSDSYNKLVSDYSKKLCLTELDLMKDYQPPTDLYLEVRALEDITISENDFASGDKTERKIEMNQSYLLKRSDIDVYIRRGLFSINE